MVDFGECIKKPFSDMKTLLVGMIIGAIPIVNILLSGFILKVAEDTTKGKNKLRSWAAGDILDYIVKAILAAIVGIVYFIIPIILIFLGIGSALFAILGTLLPSMDPNALGSGTPPAVDPMTIVSALLNGASAGAPLIIIGIILAIIAALILPMAIMKWLKSGSLAAAFNVPAVIKNCLTGKYIIALIVGAILAIIIGAILSAIGMVLLLIPIVGFILMALVSGLSSYIVGVMYYSMLAQTVD